MALNYEADGVPTELLPVPTAWRVMIAPVKLKEVSEGGIALLSSSVSSAQHFVNVAKVIALGELCYQDAAFKNGNAPSCKVGDIINYQCHDGTTLTIGHNGEEHKLRFIKDSHVVSVIKDTSIIEALL